MERIRANPRESPLDPTLVALQDLVNGDVILKPLSDNMFTEVPDVAPYNEDPTHNQELRSFSEMLEAFNVLLTMGPQWNDIANKVGLIGCPFNAILDWPMASMFHVPLIILESASWEADSKPMFLESQLNRKIQCTEYV